MSASKNKIGNIVLGIFILFCIFIMAQHKFRFVKVRELKGHIVEQEKPSLSWKTWMDKSYQKEKTKYIKEKFGLRNDFVRFHNQVAFSFFDLAKANGVVVGKDNYLFEKSYIKSYLGEDFVGEEKINDHVKLIEEINDTLIKLDKHLVVLMAPGKGWFYSDKIPDRYGKKETDLTNYQVYKKHIEKTLIPNIDFNEYFLESKESSEYLLYPKTGIHWSVFGETIVMDSLLKKLEDVSEKRFPCFTYKIKPLTDKVLYTDDDIEKGMNLYFDIDKPQMAYPEIKFFNEDLKKYNSMVVADSYFWGLFGRGVAQRFFKRCEFWYYNRKVHSEKPLRNCDDVDLGSTIEEMDFVILLCTDPNLKKLNFGFIERLHKHFYK